MEHACSITSLMLGETLPSITKDMDTYTYRLPLGVCAGIAPFNFPAMIPLWMFPMAMVCGNTFLLKPSERVPTCAMLLAKMLQDAGAPDGTLNIIHGQHAGKMWSLRTAVRVSQRAESLHCGIGTCELVTLYSPINPFCHSCELHLWPSSHQGH